MLANTLGVPLEQQRFWTWGRRQNSIHRPNSVLRASDETRVMDLRVS